MINLEDLSVQNLNHECRNLSCLEIGPFCTPVLVGNNVEYFDILTQQELVERIDKEMLFHWDLPNYGIPYIHHVEKTGNLSKINKKYDIILSSNCIEHQLNLIDHLNQVYDLLNDGGLYIVICPDKRYCFDHFLPETNLADVIEDFYLNRKRHSLKAFLEHSLLTCHNYPERHWNDDHGKSGDFKNKILTKDDIEKYFYNESIYEDVHNYKFTPLNFEEIITSLKEMNYIELDIIKSLRALDDTYDFKVILKRA